jgi:hypothetical protein
MKLTPNINGTGRVLRAVSGLLMLALAWWAWDRSHIATGVLLVLAMICFFQAARGHCFARACGIKTRW